MVCSDPENEDKKESPSDDKSKDDLKKSPKTPEEDGVDSANDVMKKFLEKSD